MTSKETELKLEEDKVKSEDWMTSKWRPAMGWMYMVICLFDFLVAPILWSILQSLSHGSVQTQWQPLTLQGAGLFHLAMGAVLGIAAYGRTQEKLGNATMSSTTVPPMSMPPMSPSVSPVASAPVPRPVPTMPMSTPAPVTMPSSSPSPLNSKAAVPQMSQPEL
jgi:hypothetical protein